jgi:hypothetical protein
MINQPYITAYVDYSVLNILAEKPLEKERTYRDWQAIHNMWRQFKENRIRFSTCGEDTEIDIIFWLNKKGCCVADTDMIIEAIEDFEEWGKVDKKEIEKYKQIIEYYEQLEILPTNLVGAAGDYGMAKYPQGIADPEKRFFSFLRDEVLCFERQNDYSDNYHEEDYNILKDCLKDLHLWFTHSQWSDLRHIHYQLNWDILVSVLANRSIEPVFIGVEGERNRNLFGLLNRVIGFSKKSWRELPVDNGHIGFVINTVMQKYHYRQEERDARHICNCVRHNINLFITIDYSLIDGFNRKRYLLLDHPEFSSIKLELVTPSEFEGRVLATVNCDS